MRIKTHLDNNVYLSLLCSDLSKAVSYMSPPKKYNIQPGYNRICYQQRQQFIKYTTFFFLIFIKNFDTETYRIVIKF